MIFSGTYSATSDCTGTATIQGELTANLRFTLVEGGQEADAIDTDPGVVAAGQISKIQLERCSNETLNGAYAFAETGSAYGPGGEVGDVAAYGRIVFDGDGNDTETSQASFNGLQNADTQTGAYSINPDCTGSAVSTHHPSGQIDTVDFVMVEGGTEAKFIVTNAGAMFEGTVDKQPLDAD